MKHQHDLSSFPKQCKGRSLQRKIGPVSCPYQSLLIVFLLVLVAVTSDRATANTLNSANYAQQQVTLRGMVQSGEDNQPLSGVSIISEGRSLLATDENGRFEVSIAAGVQLTFSLIGYESHTITATKTESDLVVTLQLSTTEISEVVVTALGIEREAKGLGYAVSTIKGEDLTEAMPNSWSDALKGKVAGLNLTQAGSGPLNSTRINLRGDRSFDASGNEALIVVDGVPMINGRVSSGVNDAYGAGVAGIDNDIPIDFGNGLGDINPDDIESVTVLKGAAATALYGSRAGNGALIITTKSGKKRAGGIGITINSNSSINDILKWPDMQHEYGQGNNNRNADGELYYSYGLSEDGANTGSTSSAFGPKFDGQLYYQYDPTIEAQSTERLPWVPYKNNVSGFFRNGMTLTNSASFDGATDNFSARASFTHTKNEWIMPNTGYERFVASLNTSAQLSEKLKINAKFAYTSKSSDNLPGTGYNNQSISYFMIFQNPNVDLAVYEPRWRQGQEQIAQIHPYSSFIENPFLIAHEMTNSLASMNIDGNLQGIYTFSPKWELMVRSGLNLRQDMRENRRPWDTANFPRGYYKQQDVYFFESNNDVLLTFKDKLSEQFNMTASLGGNLMRNQNKQNDAVARGLTLPGVYKLSNAMDIGIANNLLYQKEIHSIYGLVNLSWQDKIFVDITGRNDWSSTLPAENRSYFYPSVSSSYILSDIFDMPNAISFAKLRLSWAMVGNDTQPYRLHKYYAQTDFPGSTNAPAVLHNANLKPEISDSWEGGVNFALFNNRINADVNLYHNVTINQVLRVPMDITTGYSSAFINGGKVRNQGVELLLSGKPVATQNFTWTSTLTWAKNDNRILELSADIESEEQIIAQSGAGVVSVIATVGGTTGDLWGFGLVRNNEGQVVFDANTGLAVRPTEIQKIGNAYADWRGGFQNEFSYKNWRMSVLVDGQYGGIVYSQTHHKMSEQGKLKHTLHGRETMTVIGDGVVRNADGGYSPNTTPAAIQTWYADYYRRANVETNSFDASFLKLREVRLEYALPRNLTTKMRVSGASIALYGRDLAMISNFPMFDPETAALNGATIMPGVEMGQMPSTRTWGVNLRLSL